MSAPNNRKIKITVNKLEVEASLHDSEMSRDFISMLPLNLTMKDLFCREKFASLPRSISKEGNQIQTYDIGDVAYWAPGQDIRATQRDHRKRRCHKMSAWC